MFKADLPAQLLPGPLQSRVRISFDGVIFRKEQGFLPNHGEEHDTLNHEASSNAIKRLHWRSAVGGKLCQPKLEFSSFDPLPFCVPTENGGFRRLTRRFSFTASLVRRPESRWGTH